MFEQKKTKLIYCTSFRVLSLSQTGTINRNVIFKVDFHSLNLNFISKGDFYSFFFDLEIVE
jgi:hypothetical protein